MGILKIFRYKYTSSIPPVGFDFKINSRVMIIAGAIFGIDVCRGWPGGWWTSSDEKNVRKAAGG